MTQAEFLKKLAAKTKRTKAKWIIYKGGQIRCDDERCPVEFVAGVGRGSWRKANARLKTRGVIGASDFSDGTDVLHTRIRHRILHAVGLAALVLCFASPAMAHRTEKPGPEKPSQEKPTPERPTAQTPERPSPNPTTPEAHSCALVRQVDAKGVVTWVLPVECRYVVQDPVRRNVRPPVVVAYPPVFRPMPIQTHITHPGPPIVLQVIHGKPQVKLYSTCVEQGKPINCRVPEAKPVTVPAPKPVVVNPKPKKRLMLPFGQ